MNEESRLHKVLRFAVVLTLILATAAAFGLVIFLAEKSPPRVDSVMIDTLAIVILVEVALTG